MSDSSEHEPRAPDSADGIDEGRSGGRGEGPGVLAGLPRIRPQRASARRVAARASRSARSNVVGKAPVASKPQPKQRSQARRRGPAKESVPTQGYEAELESLHGPIHPPGGAELVASAAELAGELAKSGVNTGVRVLRDFLSRLPG